MNISYALFKAKDKKLLESDDLASRLEGAEKINEEYVFSYLVWLCA